MRFWSLLVRVVGAASLPGVGTIDSLGVGVDEGEAGVVLKLMI
jgi:hypothetical protein